MPEHLLDGASITSMNVVFNVSQVQTSVTRTHLALHAHATNLMIVLPTEQKEFKVRTNSASHVRVWLGGFLLACWLTKWDRACKPPLLGITVYSDFMSSVNRIWGSH